MRFLTFAATAMLFMMSTSPLFAASKADFDKAYGAAVATQKKAASIGGEWRDIGTFLKNAKKLAEEGDYDRAIKLAKKAKQPGELGHDQAMAQQGKGVTPSMLR